MAVCIVVASIDWGNDPGYAEGSVNIVLYALIGGYFAFAWQLVFLVPFGMSMVFVWARFVYLVPRIEQSRLLLLLALLAYTSLPVTVLWFQDIERPMVRLLCVVLPTFLILPRLVVRRLSPGVFAA